MKKTLISLIILIGTNLIFGQRNTYFSQEDFIKNFGQEMVKAEHVYQSFVKKGIKDLCFVKVNFNLRTDQTEKLDSLKQFLQTTYSFNIGDIFKTGNVWEMTCESNPIPFTSENLLYFALDIYIKAYTYDVKSVSFDLIFDPDNRVFPDLNPANEENCFNKGMDCYLKDDLSGAIINWSLSILINPDNPNAYFSRAVVKNELFTWKAAIKDYDKALELAPAFLGALINRGDLKLENGDYEGALDDYNRVLTLEQNDPDILTGIYFNRGNAKYLIGDKTGACEDWNKAFDLGANDARVRIDEYCN